MKRLISAIFILISHLSYAQNIKAIKAKVDSLINPLVITNNYSGSVLISRKSKTIYTGAYGLMNREYNLRNTIETKFFLASVSMIFTSAGIMKLVEKGQVSLTDPLSRFLPSYKKGDEITIHHLLAQQSGIPAIGAGGNVDYDSITKFTHSTDQLIDYFKNYDLLFKPGSKYNHGRSDYILLAKIIEKVTGKSFGEFLKAEIFLPLKMNNTGHYAGETVIIPNVAKGYAPKDLYELESAYQIDWSSKTGHASIYSTAGDLEKFAQAILQNKLLTKQSWNTIFTNNGSNSGYGWFVANHMGRKRYQMNGRAPGFSSYIGIYPEEELIVIMLSNNYVSLPSAMGKPLACIGLDTSFEKLNLTNTALAESYAKKLTGVYKFDEKFYRPNFNLEVTYKDGNIFTTWGGLIPIDKGDKAFKNFILRTYWSDIRFVEDKGSEVNEILFDNHKGIKVR